MRGGTYRRVARSRTIAGGVAPRLKTLLKRDALGRVELLEDGARLCVRRGACGGRVPGSGWLARVLLRRERAALEALAELDAVPHLEPGPAWAGAPGCEGRVPDPRTVLVRTFCEGSALHQAERLPADFFERLRELVESVHRCGVCHNDLHKEQNVVVGDDGRPALLDFQLASVHRSRGRRFRSRCGDDLRHVAKHHRRYTRDGRAVLGGAEVPGPAELPRRSALAGAWRRFGKPLYNRLTRSLSWQDGEVRRPSSGPWPAWTEPVGPRGRGLPAGTEALRSSSAER